MVALEAHLRMAALKALVATVVLLVEDRHMGSRAAMDSSRLTAVV